MTAALTDRRQFVAASGALALGLSLKYAPAGAQNPAALKALENRGVQLDVEEGAQATTEVQIIPIGELLQAIQEQE